MNSSTDNGTLLASEEPSATPAAGHSSSNANPRPRRRSRFRTFVQLLRRGHLYAGLFMLPWTILYAVTAVLFNHPTLFSDQAIVSFGKEALAGTPMESPPAPLDLANQVVAALRERSPEASYALIEPDKARYTQESVFAIVRADGQQINVLINATGQGGTIRSRPIPPAKTTGEKAPFAIAGRDPNANDMRAKRPEAARLAPGDRMGAPSGDALRLDQPLHERVKATVPTLLEKNGFPQGEAAVNFVPELTFLMKADDKVWKVNFNQLTGAVSGRAPDANSAEPLSTRQFLLRLHLAHGYPGEANVQWGWALVVDVMAAIMLFWSVSGLLMWWQIKATRRLGVVMLILSTIAAVWVGLAMHDHMTAMMANR